MLEFIDIVLNRNLIRNSLTHMRQEKKTTNDSYESRRREEREKEVHISISIFSLSLRLAEVE